MPSSFAGDDDPFLSGLRVLDLTDERALLAGRMLANLGADIVQAEPRRAAVPAAAPRTWPARAALPGRTPRMCGEAFAANK